LAIEWAQLSNKISLNKLAFKVTAVAEVKQENIAAATETLRQAIKLGKSDGETQRILADLLIRQNRSEDARQILRKLIEVDTNDNVSTYLLILSYAKGLGTSPLPPNAVASSDPATTVLDLFAKINNNIVKSRPDVLLVAAQANYRLRRPEQARKLAEQYLKIVPDSEVGSRYMAALEHARLNPDMSVDWPKLMTADHSQ
jgi:tetratricopeptide (TPR) repeat protein